MRRHPRTSAILAGIRRLARRAAAVAALAAAECALAFPASNEYLSPRNAERPLRTATKYIVLHTTEGSAKGSLEKLRANGECHYAVNTNGVVYRVVERRRVAFHAGVSMWNGETSLDNVSIGIEVVGYHNRPITEAQIRALRPLLDELKQLFAIPDHCVLTHSMVAYGTPNKWQRHDHRGRKRCGMQFADTALRRRIGLATRPAFDPDLRAGRLVDADPELTRILYNGTGVDPTRGVPPSKVAGPPAVPPGAANPPPKPSGHPAPVLTRPNRGLTVRPGVTAYDLAPGATRSKVTFYITPNRVVRCGAELTPEAVAKVPEGTVVLANYRKGGPVTASNPAFAICGTRWNRPETFYFTPEQGLISGATLTERTIPLGAYIFYKR